MSEHKGDELSATGSHRVWTGETAGSVVRAGAPRDTQRNWLDRAGSVPASQPANSRHAAITRSLNSWSNYKSWTDKVRSNWDKDKGGK
ncbi:MAG TPA: hypothetical protein VN705_06530 [Steroidobacteraceae bacterium]|jgi:hypothetical protein|nr:hypothetical protein [Steroidobacteraceae bacterium]